MKHMLCKLEDIPPVGTKLVDFFGRQVHVYQVDGTPKAVANTCLHFGGPLEYQDGKFVCSWHGATFDAQNGQCLKGPAPSTSRLMALSTVVEEGALFYVWGD